MSDTGYAPPRWEFDDEVTRVFDDMLERSIPQYQTMRDAVTRVASAFLAPNSTVLDLGCSRGDTLAALADLPGTSLNQFVGIEISEPMWKAAIERFDVDTRVRILHEDLRNGFAVPPLTTCVALSVLTLMFVPTNYRRRIVQRVHDVLAPGGGFVVVEKVLGGGAKLDDVFNANYHDAKRRSGYTPDDIARKRIALEGELVPLEADYTVELLRSAGFREIDTFWAWMNFRGFVAVKEKERR